jgi:hypothetical protein
MEPSLPQAISSRGKTMAMPVFRSRIVCWTKALRLKFRGTSLTYAWWPIGISGARRCRHPNLAALLTFGCLGSLRRAGPHRRIGAHSAGSGEGVTGGALLSSDEIYSSPGTTRSNDSGGQTVEK